jgi:hypothetical protein
MLRLAVPAVLLLALTALVGPPPIAPFAPAQGGDATPGPDHARLTALAGDWTVTTTFRFGDAPPQEFHGTARATAILGGRFVQFDEQATEFGQRVERQKVFGFNNAARRFESTWRYTGSTATMNLTGSLAGGAADATTITGTATFADEGDAVERFTWDLRTTAADAFTSTLVAAAGDGKPQATFTAVYRRRAAK